MYSDVIMLTTWCIFHNPMLFAAMKLELHCPVADGPAQEFHMDAAVRKHWATWLAARSGSDMWNNAIDVFLWLCRYQKLS
jgi:hypothetical protein